MRIAIIGGHGKVALRLHPLLREAGHEVYAVTPTGLGDRTHLADPAINLDVYITDVVNTINFARGANPSSDFGPTAPPEVAGEFQGELAEVMEKNKQAGIATFVMREREYLVAIIAALSVGAASENLQVISPRFGSIATRNWWSMNSFSGRRFFSVRLAR